MYLNNLRHTNFVNADLSGSWIYNSLLDGANIINSSLRNVEFHWCKAHANFSNLRFILYTC